MKGYISTKEHLLKVMEQLRLERSVELLAKENASSRIVLIRKNYLVYKNEFNSYEDFIESGKNKVRDDSNVNLESLFEQILEHFVISEDLIEEYACYINLNNIEGKQPLSEGFLELFQYEVFWPGVFEFQNISSEFRKKFAHKFETVREYKEVIKDDDDTGHGGYLYSSIDVERFHHVPPIGIVSPSFTQDISKWDTSATDFNGLFSGMDPSSFLHKSLNKEASVKGDELQEALDHLEEVGELEKYGKIRSPKLFRWEWYEKMIDKLTYRLFK